MDQAVRGYALPELWLVHVADDDPSSSGRSVPAMSEVPEKTGPRGGRRITRQCSGPSRRVSFLWFENRRGAGSATDRPYVSYQPDLSTSPHPDRATRHRSLPADRRPPPAPGSGRSPRIVSPWGRPPASSALYCSLTTAPGRARPASRWPGLFLAPCKITPREASSPRGAVAGRGTHRPRRADRPFSFRRGPLRVRERGPTNGRGPRSTAGDRACVATGPPLHHAQHRRVAGDAFTAARPRCAG